MVCKNCGFDDEARLKIRVIWETPVLRVYSDMDMEIHDGHMWRWYNRSTWNSVERVSHLLDSLEGKPWVKEEHITALGLAFDRFYGCNAGKL
jgi:hypothetical protein